MLSHLAQNEKHTNNFIKKDRFFCHQMIEKAVFKIEIIKNFGLLTNLNDKKRFGKLHNPKAPSERELARKARLKESA